VTRYITKFELHHQVWETETFQTASDLLGHWQWCHSIGQILFPISDSSIATMSLSFTVNDILSLISQNLKRSRDSEHIFFGGNVSHMH